MSGPPLDRARLGAVLAAIVVGVSPFDVGRPVDGWTDLHLRPLLLLTAVLALAMLAATPASIDRPLGLATGALVAGFAAASLASPDPGASLAVTVRVAVLGLVFWAVAAVSAHVGATRALVLGAAIGVGLSSVVGLAVLAAGGDRWGTEVLLGSISVSRGVTRLTRPFSHANVAAMYLAPAIVLITGAVGATTTAGGPASGPSAGRAGRLALVVVAGLGAVALSLTLSRGGIVALVAACCSLAAVLANRRRNLWTGGVVLPVAVVALAVGVGVASGRWGARLGDPAIVSVDGVAAPLAPSRPTIWGQAVDAWIDQPWTGVGPGRFGTYARSVTPPGQAAAAHAHNPILEALATGGLLALAGVLAFGAVVIWRAGRRWSTVPLGLSAALAAAILPMVADDPFLFSSSGNLAAVVGGAWYGAARVAAP